MPKHKNKKYISVNNWESKHGQLMKFGQFMSYYKAEISSKNYAKTVV